VSVPRIVCCLVVLATVLPAAARAQQSDSTCSSLGTPRVGALDTVITLDIRDRTWQRDAVTTGMAFSAGGTSGTQRGTWRACVGVSAHFRRVTTTLHNVRGRIHLKVDPAALDSTGLRSTSPADPPRR